MDTHALVDLNAIRRNCRNLSAFAQKPVLAPIKANAYGHGAVAVAKALEADPACHCVGVAVATAREVFELRQGGVGLPIVLLTPAAPQDLEALVAAQSGFVVSSLSEVQALQVVAQTQRQRVPVHLKINTGLNRLGASAEDAPQVLSAIGRAQHLLLEGVMTHLVDSEDAQPEHAFRQIECFKNFLQTHRPDARYRHLANTGGVLNRALDAHFDLVRPGIGLYGYAPGPDMEGIVALWPAMTLRARVLFVKTIQANEVVSYNATWRSSQASRLATVRLGYADGYPRALSNRASMVLKGQLVPVVGRVCMDQTLLEVTALEQVEVGDFAEVFGPGAVSAQTLATLAGTNCYEVLTSVAARVERVYTT